MTKLRYSSLTCTSDLILVFWNIHLLTSPLLAEHHSPAAFYFSYLEICFSIDVKTLPICTFHFLKSVGNGSFPINYWWQRFHRCFPSLVRWYELYPWPFFKSILSYLGSSDSIFWRISPYLCNIYFSVSHGDSSVLSRDLLDSHLISFLFNSHFLSDVCHLCMDLLIAVFSSLSELKQICDNEENQIWWFH